MKALVDAGDSYSPGVPPAVQHTLTVLCTTAHKKGVAPEGVLVLIKRTWKTYLANADPGLAVREVWYSDLITRCIEDFYSTRG